MKEHFTKLQSVMDKYEEACERHLSDLLRRQDEKIKYIQDGIVNEMDKLNNDHLNLKTLEGNDDNEIIYMTNIIDD